MTKRRRKSLSWAVIAGPGPVWDALVGAWDCPPPGFARRTRSSARAARSLARLTRSFGAARRAFKHAGRSLDRLTRSFGGRAPPLDCLGPSFEWGTPGLEWRVSNQVRGARRQDRLPPGQG